MPAGGVGYAAAVILLSFPDGRVVTVDDGDAVRLSDLLWEMAGTGTKSAFVALAIQQESRRRDVLRQPIDVPPASVERLDAALSQLH